MEAAVVFGVVMLLVLLAARKFGKRGQGGDSYPMTADTAPHVPHRHQPDHDPSPQHDRDCAPQTDSRSDAGFCGPSDSGGSGDSGGGGGGGD